MSPSTKRRHTTRWLAGGVLAVLVVVGVVLATSTPEESTQVDSPLLGHMAPTFSGTDLRTGHHVSLTALRGHYVVVNFFASWCTPCVDETPDLVTFAYNQAHEAGGATVVGVVFHDETAAARAFQRSEGAIWPTVADPGGTIAQAFGVTNPPTTFVIDPSGRITVNPVLGPEKLKDFNKLLRQAQHSVATSSNA
jgi:cytochrome c biogenesis protein CcmG/thiol:disulfide interchange protein DsbE